MAQCSDIKKNILFVFYFPYDVYVCDSSCFVWFSFILSDCVNFFLWRSAVIFKIYLFVFYFPYDVYVCDSSCFVWFSFILSVLISFYGSVQ